MAAAPVYSIVVPVYNAAQTLPALTARIVSVMQQQGDPFELIFVDDCSKDAGWQVLLGLKANYPFIKLYQLQQNSGQHTATLCGALKASGQTIITIDDDLQINPEDIPALLQTKQQTQAQVVYGRFTARQQQSYRTLGRRLVFIVVKRIMPGLLHASSFRAFNRSMLQDIDTSYRRYYTLDVSLIQQQPSLAYVNVQQQQRKQGSSNYNLRFLVGFVASYFINFTLLPVRILLFMGALLAILGFVWGWYTVTNNVNLFLASVMVCCTGFMLIGLALWAEYFARYMQANSARTLFVINQRLE